MQIHDKLRSAILLADGRGAGDGKDVAVDRTAAPCRPFHWMPHLPDPEQRYIRADPYHRLSRIVIRIDPLREHKEDIPLLAEYFRMTAAPHSINRPKAFKGEAIGKLMAHEWPGNVHELRNVVERACYIARNPYIERENIQIDEVMSSPTVHTENITLDDLERQHLIAMLQRHNNRVVDVAQALGVSRSALYYRLSRHGIRARKINSGKQKDKYVAMRGGS